MATSDTDPVTDIQPADSSRRHQMFPVLAEADIARMKRFGTVQYFKRGDRVVTAGEPSPGMFVVCQGELAMTQRDGMGHVVPVVVHHPGEFSAEVGQLSEAPSLVDGHA